MYRNCTTIKSSFCTSMVNHIYTKHNKIELLSNTDGKFYNLVYISRWSLSSYLFVVWIEHLNNKCVAFLWLRFVYRLHNALNVEKERERVIQTLFHRVQTILRYLLCSFYSLLKLFCYAFKKLKLWNWVIRLATFAMVSFSLCVFTCKGQKNRSIEVYSYMYLKG